MMNKPTSFVLSDILTLRFLLKRKFEFLPMNTTNSHRVTAPPAFEPYYTTVQQFEAIDAVYMNAANKFGWHFIAGVVRQNNGIVNSLFYLKVPGIGLLQAPKLPDTFSVLPKDKVGTFSTNYLTFVPIQAMTLWKVSYRGPMRLLGDSKRKFNVKLEATFKSKLKVFDFDVDMKDNTIIKSISCEPWSISYFKRLKDYHQTHYEQHGELNGSVSIDGVHFDLLLNCMRDHSYGRRDWTLFHRYILHIFTLEDGTKGNVGIVCAPSMFTRLEIGYIYLPNGTLLPLESIDLSFYQHGEAGTPPLDYGFTFKAGGETYLVQVIVKESAEFYYGNNWEARIVENLCRFVVNGIEGWGATEWQYRNYTSRRTEIKPGYRKDQY
uniref:Uncharacterized protein n=2 Tax=Clastoptera arizonana TaxID=38151 RepID=A0A1B6EEL4_9HEMI